MEAILSDVEAIAELLMLAEPNDLMAFGDALNRCERIHKWALQGSHARVSGAAETVIKLLEHAIMAEPEAAMALVQQANASLEPLQQSISAAAAGAATGPRPRDKEEEETLAEFLEQQPARLEAIENLALRLERDYVEADARELYGIMHTLKGDAAVVGMTEVQQLCQTLEEYLAGGRQHFDSSMMLASKDWLESYFASVRDGAPPPPPAATALWTVTAEGAKSAPFSAPEPIAVAPPALPSQPPATATEEQDQSLLEEFRSEAGQHLQDVEVQLLTLESEPGAKDAVRTIFRAFHTIKGVAGFLNLSLIGYLAHEAENLLDRVCKDRMSMTPDAVDVTFDTVDALRGMVSLAHAEPSSPEWEPWRAAAKELTARIEAIIAETSEDETTAPAGPPVEQAAPAKKKIGEILVERGTIPEAELTTVLCEQAADHDQGHPRRRLGEVLIAAGKVAPREVAAALRVQRAAEPQKVAQVHEQLRVDADRVDRLVESIGELVISAAALADGVKLQDGDGGQGAMSRLLKTCRELQELGTSLRMVPLRATFQKMARVVRDLARKTDRPVEFSMVGEDTELDKAVVDRIGDPLLHLVRNAVDHGIEPHPAERAAAGKPANGNVTLRAFHQGGEIHIEVCDDGRGLDAEAILRKARERGLVGDSERLSLQETYQLIFHPGLSTASQVTDVSGRGVGMEVVKKTVESLRGQVMIETERGCGTVFRLRLPLTLAVIEGMVVRVASERYIIPTLAIRRVIQPQRSGLSTVVGKGEVLLEQGAFVPLMRLSDTFRIAGAEQDATRSVILLMGTGRQAFGLVVDELIGQQQIVIKSLGEGLGKVTGIAGGAIMSDGTVGLIIDVADLASTYFDSGEDKGEAK
ncbi:MAG: chemotaxis protein CheA [Candidatus Schekmanbacteria bacterium]|nr:chemotaxis protein CheA [Candidatus Schekmanbacteria bacterium]